MRVLTSVVLLVAIVLIAFAGALSGRHSAEASGLDVWGDVYDVLVNNVDTAGPSGDYWHMHGCEPMSITVEHPARIDAEDACVATGNEVSLAIFLYGDYEYMQYALKKSDDTNFHLVIGFGGMRSLPIESEDGRLVVSLYSLLVHIDDFPDYFNKIATNINATDIASYYEIDSSGANYFKNVDGSSIYARNIGVSENGRYAVAEVYDKGVIIINLATLSVKYIAKDTISYMDDEYMRLTVSNNGKRVAVVSDNYELAKVYSVDNDCSYDTHEELSDGEDCYSIDLNYRITESDILDDMAPYNIYFSNNNEQLVIQSYSLSGSKPNYNTIIMPDVDARFFDYLALGDSFSSGEGDVEKSDFDHKHYRPGTDFGGSYGSPQERCHLSTRSYPYLLAQGMKLALDSPKEWNSIACSGAKVEDVSAVEKWWMKSGDKYLGQNDRLNGFEVNKLRGAGLNEFIPGREQQIEFVRKYRPKVITLTMGGNDVGFGEKVGSCIRPLTCDSAKDKGRLSLANQIEGQYSKLVSLYKDLHKASGYKAKIYVLGYPQFINGGADASCEANVGALNDKERQMITESTSYLNKVIKQAAKAAGVMYVDIENSLYGHRLCDDHKDKYVTGIAATVGMSGIVTQESFHPNHNGHMQMAFTVWDNVDSESLLNYNFCGDGRNSCPDASATKDSIVRPSYFPQEKKNSEYKEMTTSTVSKGGFMDVVISTMKLKPFSLAQATLHSDPTDLGVYTAESNGSLGFNVAVPSSVPAGYHTLVVNGENVNGEPIELEQVVLVLGEDPNDVDENGIPDNQQVCGAFIEPSGLDEDMDGIDDACDPMIEIKVTEGAEYIEDGSFVANDNVTENKVRVGLGSRQHAKESPRVAVYSTTKTATNKDIGLDFGRGIELSEEHGVTNIEPSNSMEAESSLQEQEGARMNIWLTKVLTLTLAVLLAIKIVLVVRTALGRYSKLNNKGR